MSYIMKRLKEYQNLLDAHWFLTKDIYKWLNTIEELSGKDIKSLSNSNIILYKDIARVIHAIDNRLELRGRDSLGISIVLNADYFSFKDEDAKKSKSLEESFNHIKHDENESCSFAFRTSSSIGALGDNARQIKNLIRNNIIFNRLIEGNVIKSASIIAHTRWASVGKVCLENTHPILFSQTRQDNKEFIYSSLNGDIYNYKSIIDSAKKNSDLNIDNKNCTTDCLAIPLSLRDIKDLDLKNLSKISDKYQGSFAIAIQHSSAPHDVFISKKGIQGLYIGFSYDGCMFASDVYGLVESCKYFLPIDSDTSLRINSNSQSTSLSPNLSILSNTTGNENEVKKEELRITNITTRDIDKGEYDHFLEKEIYETSDIVMKTVNAYLQPKNSIDTNLEKAIVMSSSQVPDFINSSLKNNKIKKIIITGMGTCYTAAVAISMYMRSRLREFIPEVLVEPHIASEGSAFYLQANMQDTLVIVIAQSGTTVDTNVYVQMAKERGALSLAIANKREGDVTFICRWNIVYRRRKRYRGCCPFNKNIHSTSHTWLLANNVFLHTI